MTTRSDDPADEGFWRRPPTPDGTLAPDGQPPPDGPPARPMSQPTSQPAGAAGRPAYSGPPPSVAPPPGWRPPVHIQPPPPRRLPPQDLPGLDSAESGSHTLTYGVGMLAAAVLGVVLCLLCSRLLF